MIEKIENLISQAESFNAQTADELEQFRVRMLGKKGEVTELFNQFKNVAAEQKKEFGQKLNQLKNQVQDRVNELKAKLEAHESAPTGMDLSLPPGGFALGTRHPVNKVMNEIIEIFARLGFTVSEGPEVEDDYHNFSALNFAPEHPARDMQDTFFVAGHPDTLLRTHTSSVQVRTMEGQKPPIRTISPGRVFRNEAISARAHCIFHQVEGLYVDKRVSFADLKQTLLYFAKEFFGPGAAIRMRPSYFPFTEPSAEVDITCSICSGKGCNVCKHTGWLEILGCGMVHPNVLEASGIDSQTYTGFAFGMGMERIAMLRYGINDLRHFFENDLRFLKQITD